MGTDAHIPLAWLVSFIVDHSSQTCILKPLRESHKRLYARRGFVQSEIDARIDLNRWCDEVGERGIDCVDRWRVRVGARLGVKLHTMILGRVDPKS